MRILHYTPNSYSAEATLYPGGMQTSLAHLISILNEFDHYVFSRYGFSTDKSYAALPSKTSLTYEQIIEIELMLWPKVLDRFKPDLVLVHGWWTNVVEPNDVPVLFYNHILPHYFGATPDQINFNYHHYTTSKTTQEASQDYLGTHNIGWLYPSSFHKRTPISMGNGKSVAVSRLDTSKNCFLVLDWLDGILYTSRNTESIRPEHVAWHLAQDSRVKFDVNRVEMFDQIQKYSVGFSNVHQYECFGTSIYEFASHGLPVISNSTLTPHPATAGILEPWMYRIVNNKKEATEAFQELSSLSIKQRGLIQESVLTLLSPEIVRNMWISEISKLAK